MREVADRRRWPMSSVSRVLSAASTTYRSAMRERVLAAVDALGYRPDLLARGAARGDALDRFVVGDIF